MSIVRRGNERTTLVKEAFGGPGEITMTQLINCPEELFGKGRLFNHVKIEPGKGLGWHIHHGDSETYYILKGHGEYSDNGNIIDVYSGDVMIVGDGEGHCIKNVGDETLEMIALIVYTD